MDQNPEKHTRYLRSYQPNDFFWGLGIENETYLQFSKSYSHPTTGIYTNHKPERYSVNYYMGLDQDYKIHLKELFPIEETHYQIPIFINAHTLQKTDISGNHATTYEKVPKPNPKFLGLSIHDVLCKYNPGYFSNRYKVNYMYDGDTIEFMTQDFYKATVKSAIKELVEEKHIYINSINEAFQALNIFPEFGKLKYPIRNEPFVSFLTNKANIAIFNNGTYHFNLTLPTLLDSELKPANEEEFIETHRNLIRYIQLLEPFLIVKYGTPDPFSKVSPKYSSASQRCAVSRYIGIGTYDTDTMPTGKILNLEVNEIKYSKLEYWWYSEYNKTSNYNPLPRIGVDINFRKHGVHGIELRVFDWFPEQDLEHLLTILVHLCDYSLSNQLKESPVIDRIWNSFVVRSLQQSKTLELEEDEFRYFAKKFNIPDINKRNLLDVLNQIEKILLGYNGICVKSML